jgi:hypothetical protein
VECSKESAVQHGNATAGSTESRFSNVPSDECRAEHEREQSVDEHCWVGLVPLTASRLVDGTSISAASMPERLASLAIQSFIDGGRCTPQGNLMARRLTVIRAGTTRASTDGS